jgi:pyruvate formate lyase activating enzyme
LRDNASVAPITTVTPGELVEKARRLGARLVVSSYNEPLITAEWAVRVFQTAREHELCCAFVSNGNATPEALDFLAPWISAYKVDLKSFDDNHYRTLGGTLEHVKDTIRGVHERRIWLEVLTLIVPGFNDGEEELRALARFIAGLSPDIPWHITAFHQDYKMTDPRNTVAADLVRAAEIGVEVGLHFVYAGNLPGRVGEWENTRCPQCRQTLIERYGYLVQSYRITAEGKCPSCGQAVPGVWPDPATVVTGRTMSEYYARLPKPVTLGTAK